jgi:hypothetical protein
MKKWATSYTLGGKSNGKKACGSQKGSKKVQESAEEKVVLA